MLIEVRSTKKLALEGGAPVRDCFLVFGLPAIEEAEIQEVVDTLRSGWLGTGPKVQRFQEDFRRYTGARHAIALNSCTAGLELALEVAGVGPGDEVITSPTTFASTANVIVHRGAKPVFADVDRETMNIDPALVERAVTRRTKALVPVHLCGRPCDMDAILDIAGRRRLAVIEDAAHAAETFYKGRKVGAIGDVTAFSFYVTKSICTGEGGMLTTGHDEWAEQLRVKSLHGISRDAWKRYSSEASSSEGYQPYETLYPGYKFNMMDIQAALGIHQLARIEENLKLRERYWRMYDQAFTGAPGLIIPSSNLEPGSRHARHLYTLLLDIERLTIGRNRFIEAMRAENVGTGVHFTALPLHKYYRDAYGFQPGDFPNAEWIGERTVSLPLSTSMTERDAEDVIEAVLKIVAASLR